MEPILATDLPFPKKIGKVRDVYEVDQTKLLIVTTDRISAFDEVLPVGIPLKGKILNSLSLYWFDLLQNNNHLITGDVDEVIQDFPILSLFRHILIGRCMLVEREVPLPIEFVVRGYLSGSAWKEYQRTGSILDIKLPKGLQENAPLPEPILTPTTKAESGHDIPITHDEMIETVKHNRYIDKIIEGSINSYKRAASWAFQKGIIIADTKFEWSKLGVLIDEVLTPDSSRFWAVENYRLGQSIESYDKQFVRDYLTKTGEKTLPPEIVTQTYSRYVQAYESITGKQYDIL